MMKLPLFNRNVFVVTLLSLLWAWQFMLLSAFILSHYPASSPLASRVFPEWRDLLKPEWKTLIYHGVLMAAVVFQGTLLWLNRGALETKDLLRQWKAYLTVEMVLTFLWSTAAFKFIVYAERPDLAKGTFVVLMPAVFLCKVFYRRWDKWAEMLFVTSPQIPQNGVWQRMAAWLMPVVIAILLFVPPIEGVVAREFIGEQFHHADGSFMGPGWAYLSGQTLDVNTISEYGIGFVVVISRIAQFCGGFSYESVMAVVVALTIIYYIAWYFLIRRWLGSVLLTAALMLLAIKWQMFHMGAYPFVFTYFSMTPMRVIYDVIYFWCLWMHIQTGNKNWLLGAGVACGFGIYYLTSEGTYGTASFGAYILLLLGLPAWRGHFRLRVRDGFLVLLPVAVAAVFLTLTIGSHIATAQFWNNIGEFINYFLSGFGLEPMSKNLVEHKYLESLMSFVIPMGYLLTLLIVLSRLIFNLAQGAEWMVVVLCLYGLGTFHYFVARSTGTSYDAVCLPFVFILGFWVKMGLDRLKEQQRRGVRFILLALSVWALMTTHMFLSYPNIINLSSHPITDSKVALPLPADGSPYFNHLFRHFDPALKLSVNSLGNTQEEILAESDFKDDVALVEYYRKNSRFDTDARLMASLTAHSDEVPLISGFEVEMLMQAHRKPFFYYFPLLISRPMSMRSFEVCSIYTKDQLAKTIKKFEDVKPPYVFMERIYMVNEVPRAYLFQFPSLIPLVNYVRTHYTPVAQGEYLVALKRIQS